MVFLPMLLDQVTDARVGVVVTAFEILIVKVA